MQMIVFLLISALASVFTLLGFLSDRMPTIMAVLATMLWSLAAIGILNIQEPYTVVYENAAQAGDMIIEEHVRDIAVNENVVYLFFGLTLLNLTNSIICASRRLK